MSKEDFYALTPDTVMNALEGVGFAPTGEFQQLNSYENRVFDIRLEGQSRVVTKFYRPARWNLEALLAEHGFLHDLAEHGIPAVAPLRLPSGSTVATNGGIHFAVFPKVQARMVDELLPGDLKRVGRVLSQLHNVGAKKPTTHRPVLTADQYGRDNLHLLEGIIPVEVERRYLSAADEIFYYLDDHLEPEKFIRIHGDCHRGNLLKTDTRDGDSKFFFVDFDDFCMGPPVQDLWMLLPGSIDDSLIELEAFLEGYNEFRHFNEDDLELIPALRGLRIVHYAAWIARRWEDPSFPRLFPQFHDFNYWAAETEALEALAHSL